MNNTQQVQSDGLPNTWDNGYPSGGNYWSDYQTRYPNAAEIDSSGIWNTPYVIDSNNTDYYPLMGPYSPLALSVSISPSSATLDFNQSQSQTFTATVSGGVSPYAYKWFLNGELNYTEITSSTVSLWNFSSQNPIGNYTVFVTVMSGPAMVFAESNTAFIRVNPSLSVTISPRSQTLYVGQSPHFTSIVSGGTPPFTYQWYLNGRPFPSGPIIPYTVLPPGTYSVYLNLTDSIGITAKSNVAQITVTKSVPVGGVSAPITTFSLLAPWLSTVSLLAAAVLLKGFITKKKGKWEKQPLSQKRLK